MDSRRAGDGRVGCQKAKGRRVGDIRAEGATAG